MAMMQLQFFQNPYHYPHYTASANMTAYGSELNCTPVGVNLRGGTIRVEGDMYEMLSANYIRIDRSGGRLYAWISDIRYINARLFEVEYQVDGFRTYLQHVTLGVQYIERSPEPSTSPDPLLGSDQVEREISSTQITPPFANTRVLVVQVRPTTGEMSTITPVQPSVYQFWVTEYNVHNWQTNSAISSLLNALKESAETTNIVTMYSIPYMDTSGLSEQTLTVRHHNTTTDISGFKFVSGTGIGSRLKTYVPIPVSVTQTDIQRVNHSVQLVIPEAGILNIPDEIAAKGVDLMIDVDLYSGAANYMLVTQTSPREYWPQSVRGSSVSSIPILSDPLSTYISQNQSALATSLMGDVAMIGGGAAASIGLGGMGLVAGGGAISSGVNGLINKAGAMRDAGAHYSNPPAFLGTALSNVLNNRYWLIVTHDPIDNAQTVAQNYGYAKDKVDTLTLPSSGYIKTQACAVQSSNGTVPQWAYEEINERFDNGIHVH